MYLLLLLAQNLPTELQVCPHPQTHRVGVLWGQNSGGLAVSQVKILLITQCSAEAHTDYKKMGSNNMTTNYHETEQAPITTPYGVQICAKACKN